MILESGSEQRKVNILPRGEVFQDGLTVVADCRQLKPVFFKSFLGILQLHELRLAERSPVGRAEEKQNRALQTFQCVVRLFVTELIG